MSDSACSVIIRCYNLGQYVDEAVNRVLAVLARAATAGRIPERAVALSIDDGSVGSIETVSPICRDLALTATFFLSTERFDEEHER